MILAMEVGAIIGFFSFSGSFIAPLLIKSAESRQSLAENKKRFLKIGLVHP